MRKSYITMLGAVAVIVLTGAGCGKTATNSSPIQNKYSSAGSTKSRGVSATSQPPRTAPETLADVTANKNNMHIITLTTNFGDIQFSTYDADAPKTVKNFITLAEKGFYDNAQFLPGFHVVPDGIEVFRRKTDDLVGDGPDPGFHGDLDRTLGHH